MRHAVGPASEDRSALALVRSTDITSRMNTVERARIVFPAQKRYKSSVPETLIIVEQVQKFFPPARSGWRALLQPFEPATSLALAGISLEVRHGEAVAL